MLEALCNHEGLSDEESPAFLDMRRRARAGFPLSKAQREWVERRYFVYELDAEEPSENLVSSGAVRKTSSVVLPYEKLYRPLRPPGK